MIPFISRAFAEAATAAQTVLPEAAATLDPGRAAVEEAVETVRSAGSAAGEFVLNLPVYGTRLLMAAVAVAIGICLLQLGKMLIRRVLRKKENADRQAGQRLDTLRSILSSLLSYLMYFIMLATVLSIFGVDVTALLTVAGVGGVAIAFGSQTLVKDVISGIFLWTEGTVVVGDLVTANGLTGTVERISIRTTVLRSVNGDLFTIPNGEIRTLTNMSRDFKRAIVDIRCPYEADQRRIVALLEEEMEKLAAEVPGVDKKPDVLSITSFETDCVLARIMVACPIGEQWGIEREIRTRVKARFDAEGIVMPHYVPPKTK